MQRPFIGVSGSITHDEQQHFLLRDYSLAIVEAGGIPLLLSPDLRGEALVDCMMRLDGLLLAGGNDIDPHLFGQSPVEALGEVNPLRDGFEQEAVAFAVSHGLPVLGVCRGVQVMNAALGGTLWQDLPSQYRTADGCAPLCHRQTAPGHYPSHGVIITTDSRLHRIIPVAQHRVNSFHHQAVAQVADDLRVCAVSEDGVIEAVEHPSHPFFVGVQWHPERTRGCDAHSAALFAALVDAAKS